MRVAAIGRTSMLLRAIERLHAAGHEIAGIATCAAAPEYSVKEADFEALAKRVGADFVATQTLNTAEMHQRLRSWDAGLAVSINWYAIIGQGALDCFPYGILNAHAGDLPRFRGNAVQAWAILNGEQQIGLTVHRMVPELDAGPIYLKEFLPLRRETYIRDIFNWMEDRVPEMFLQAVEGIASGQLTPILQSENPSDSLRCYPRRPEDGLIQWSEPAEKIERLVRASGDPFAGAYTFLDGKKLFIVRAKARAWPNPALAIPGTVADRDRNAGTVSIATGDGLLDVALARYDTSHPITGYDAIRSLRDRLG